MVLFPEDARENVHKYRCDKISRRDLIMEFTGKWIKPTQNLGEVCPVFRKTFIDERKTIKAELLITAIGNYEAKINGKRVSDYVLAPGWTSYQKRLQYQVYDITEMLWSQYERENVIEVTVGAGWFRSDMPGWTDAPGRLERMKLPPGIFAEIHVTYADGKTEIIPTDTSWEAAESGFRFSEIYDGETFDARHIPDDWQNVEEFEWSTDILIPQEGEEILEKDRFAPKEIIITPEGDTVIDFGQEITGYLEFTVEAKAGEKIQLLCGEMLDKHGNFYNENYRAAKSEMNYICRDGLQTWKPVHTFFGFRYIKLAEWHGTITPDQITAIAVYSDIKRTGHIKTSNAKLNQLFSNIVWGQLGNFLDVPTDCPQRDERLGWTGDAQVFIKTATYNFDVEKFFTKWLNDLKVDQYANGAVPDVIPDWLNNKHISAAWGDAAVICPWQLYMTYGDDTILKNQFESMCKWIDYITGATGKEYLWIGGGDHYGDWCALDAKLGDVWGASRIDYVASAFYAYSTSLVIKAGKIIGVDVSKYELLYQNIVSKFRETFTTYETQTEYILALQFDLAIDKAAVVEGLAQKIKTDGNQLKTGFVGTPYILHVLSQNGYTDVAYNLLLREEYPSWLYPICKGATTIWEHWDGVMEDGSFWKPDMNSYNHYAYGAVGDWIYEEAAGIKPIEASPGFAKIKFEPKPNKKLQWLEATIDTRHGKVRSYWKFDERKIKYEIDTPVAATIIIDKRQYEVEAGNHVFWGDH